MWGSRVAGSYLFIHSGFRPSDSHGSFIPSIFIYLLFYLFFILETTAERKESMGGDNTLEPISRQVTSTTATTGGRSCEDGMFDPEPV